MGCDLPNAVTLEGILSEKEICLKTVAILSYQEHDKNGSELTVKILILKLFCLLSLYSWALNMVLQN